MYEFGDTGGSRGGGYLLWSKTFEIVVDLRASTWWCGSERWPSGDDWMERPWRAWAIPRSWWIEQTSVWRWLSIRFIKVNGVGFFYPASQYNTQSPILSKAWNYRVRLNSTPNPSCQSPKNSSSFSNGSNPKENCLQTSTRCCSVPHSNKKTFNS